MPSSSPISVAAIQFAVGDDWQHNLRYSQAAISEAVARGASLLVLPECALYTRSDDATPPYAQPLDGPFVTTLCALSQQYTVTIVAGMTTPGDATRVRNTVVVMQNGALIVHYDKLHLYDAFAVQESQHYIAGMRQPPVFTHHGRRFGVLTCYDLRFPEPARLLAEQDIDAILLPASWFAGGLKEWHWQVLCTARALENGVYLLGVNSCGAQRIGLSCLVDPYGVMVAQLGSTAATLHATLDAQLLQDARRTMPLLQQRRFKINHDVLPPPSIS